MSDQSPIEVFLVELRGSLSGVWWWRRRSIIAEVRAHLEDVAAEEHARGLDGVESERRAVQRFGDPTQMAAELRAEQRVPRWLGLTGLAAVALGVALVVVSVRSQPRPAASARYVSPYQAAMQRLLQDARGGEQNAAPPQVVGGSPAQRQLIAELARPFRLPGVRQFRIDNSYRDPEGQHWQGALILISPRSTDPSNRDFAAYMANEWAADVIVHTYNYQRHSRHVPRLGNVGPPAGWSGCCASVLGFWE